MFYLSYYRVCIVSVLSKIFFFGGGREEEKKKKKKIYIETGQLFRHLESFGNVYYSEWLIRFNNGYIVLNTF